MYGSYLNSLRTARNITQRELAEIVGVDYTYISKVENEVVEPPSYNTTVKIARALGVDEDVLLLRFGRVPEDIQEYLGSNLELIQLLRVARTKRITPHQWALLRDFLQDLS
jgi:HTH-type transcriptional regulator, competence development regulator